VRLTRDCLGGEDSGLRADLKQGEEEGMKDVAMENESLLAALAQGGMW